MKRSFWQILKTLPFEEQQKRMAVRYLREAHRYWPPRLKVLKACAVGTKHRRCSLCLRVFLNKFVHADHIEPVVDPMKGFDLNAYVSSMLVAEDKYQPLCKECHNKKTEDERVIRSHVRAALKVV